MPKNSANFFILRYNINMKLIKEQFARIEHLMHIPRKKLEISNCDFMYITVYTQKRLQMEDNNNLKSLLEGVAVLYMKFTVNIKICFCGTIT